MTYQSGGSLVDGRDFRQITWDEKTIDDCRQIIRLAVREDLDRGHDLTTMSLVASRAEGSASVVVRHPGVVAGIPAVELLIKEMNLAVVWQPFVDDGAVVESRTRVGFVRGSTRDILAAERITLNLLSRLSGIATLTSRYVRAIEGTGAHVYDTRKTTPGWRRLEKYAVRCGGGRNHRAGLFDAILIKDNHLAQAARAHGLDAMLPSEAVNRAREFVRQFSTTADSHAVLVEVEVDSLAQFEDALQVSPDIILLDNMSPVQIRECVSRRNAASSATQLEASGGISLETIRAVAETGVERISVGALTHSAVALDIGLDWDAC